MSAFPIFIRTHGPALDPIPVPDEALKAYRESLPSPLLSFWKEKGWCGFAEGLLWTVNPEQIVDVLEVWVGSHLPEAVPFVRTAFGDILFWHGGRVHYLDVLYGRVTEHADDMELLFDNTLCKERYLDGVMDRRTFRKALRRLGTPKHDECYAFVPPLAQGGPGTAETLRKAKLRDYLRQLAQATEVTFVRARQGNA